jgi:hypothetical protein
MSRWQLCNQMTPNPRPRAGRRRLMAHLDDLRHRSSSDAIGRKADKLRRSGAAAPTMMTHRSPTKAVLNDQHRIPTERIAAFSSLDV